VNDPTPRARSILQFSVALAVIGVLAVFLLDALYDVMEQAERTVMEATIRNMDSGLRVELARRMIHGQEASIGDLVGANPVQWLEAPPVGYSGNCRRDLTAGEWCFDAVTNEIVYRPRLVRNLEYHDPSRSGLRWRVSTAAELAGRRGGSAASAGAIRVASTTSFAWY
jgi:general secretion pathway protein G